MPYSKLGDIQTLTLSNDVESDNDCCILTLNNEVLIMGNLVLSNFNGSSILATMPTAYRPIDTIRLPVIFDNDIMVLIIDSEGEIRLNTTSTVSGVLYLNGLTFNVCDRYYNNEIGNNFSQGTSPLNGVNYG